MPYKCFDYNEKTIKLKLKKGILLKRKPVLEASLSTSGKKKTFDKIFCLFFISSKFFENSWDSHTSNRFRGDKIQVFQKMTSRAKKKTILKNILRYKQDKIVVRL